MIRERERNLQRRVHHNNIYVQYHVYMTIMIVYTIEIRDSTHNHINACTYYSSMLIIYAKFVILHYYSIMITGNSSHDQYYYVSHLPVL